MLRQQHDPWQVRRFHRGSNTDLDPEAVPDGFARDMKNMRSTSVDGQTGAAEKIQGYTEAHGDEGAPGQYRPIGSAVAGGKNVVVWASPDPAEHTLFRVDGVTMAYSPNIPYTWDRPLQIAVKDIGGGIMYPADGNAPPLYWDIGDMVTQYGLGSLAYFADYQITDNAVGLMAPPHFPQLVSLDDVGGTGGLLPGLYAYALRWVTAAGDRTNIGCFSPLIGVPYNLDVNGSPTSVFPGTRNYGGPTSTIGTSYAIHLEFRLDNYANFDSVEIVRVRFNDGAGILGAGVVEVVGRIAVSPGQYIPDQQFVDPGDAFTPELVPDDEGVIEQLLLDKPKGVEYMDNRLIYANFETKPQVIEPTFREVGGDTVFPFTRSVTTQIGSTTVPGSYSDPLNFAYNKSFRRGERYGLAIAPWNGLNGKMAAIPVTGGTDIQLPNRRDEKAADQLVYSNDPCTACNVSHAITPTFEAVVQGTRKKTDVSSVVNISPNSSRSSGNWDGITSAPPTNGVSYTDNGVAVTNISYAPLHPTGNNDFVQKADWDYVVNPLVNAGSATAPAYIPYAPEGFAPTPQALGIGIYGVENIPSYVNAFTVARTAPAGRVVMQGLFTYHLDQDPSLTVPVRKFTNRGMFFSPDMLNGLVPQGVIDDIIANPTSYRLQMVSPQGFYSEVFAQQQNAQLVGGSLVSEAQFIDMISYARVMHDAGEINPFDSVTIGESGYVDFGRWRSTAITGSTGTSYWHQPGQDGNSLLDINFAAYHQPSSRSGAMLNIQTDQYCYLEQEAGVSQLSLSPLLDEVRRWHEPVYVANIIRVGATPDSGGVTKYYPTSTTIMMESCIGVYDGALGGVQNFRLIGERRDDCLGYLGSDFRYVYVDGDAYLCYTNNTYLLNPVNLAAVLFDIININGWTAPDGTVVKGLYTFDTTTNSVQIGTFQTPSDGARITVRYDSEAPILTLGGDVTIDPAVFAYYDNIGSSGQGPTISSGVKLNYMPMPFSGLISNPRYLTMSNAGASETVTHITAALRSFRQWVWMFDCECVAPLSFATNLLSVDNVADYNQFYGAVNYVMRPYNVTVSSDAVANGLYVDYDISYPHEISSGTVLYGGFRFMQRLNLDYAHGELPAFASVPSVGYTEKTDFPTGVAWSAKADPLQVDTPGLRTFTQNTLHVVSEETGEIKTIYALNAGGQQNLYGRTHSGTFKLLTNKNVLVGASGEVIGTQATDVFIDPRGEIWLSRSIGSPDEYWVLGAIGAALTGSGYADSAFWADRRAAYRQVGDQIIDISTGKYWTRLSSQLVGGIDNGIYSPYSHGFFDPKHQEYWIAPYRFIQSGPGRLTASQKLWAFSCQTGEWQGEYTYGLDRYLYSAARIFGYRARRDFLLDQGYAFDGEAYEAFVESVYSKPDSMQKEAVRFREHSSTSPTRIELYDERGILMTFTDAATFGQYWIKFIDGWENFVSRTSSSYGTGRKRAQSRVFTKRTLHNLPERFALNDSQLQLHTIK